MAAQSNTSKFAELIRVPVRSLWGSPPSFLAKFRDIWSLALGSKLLLLLGELFWLCRLWGDLTAPQSQPVYHDEVGLDDQFEGQHAVLLSLIAVLFVNVA